MRDDEWDSAFVTIPPAPCFICHKDSDKGHVDFQAALHPKCADEAWRRYDEAIKRRAMIEP